MSTPRSGLAPGIVLAIAVALTVASTVYVWAVARQDRIESFRTYAGSGLSAVERELAAYTSVVRSTAALYAGSDEVTDAELALFVDRLALPVHYPGVDAVGFVPSDAPADAVRREAMDRASRSGEPATTRRLYGERDPGVIIYAPVYESASIPEEPDDRAAATRGYVYAEIRHQPMIAAAADGMPPGIEFVVFEDGEEQAHFGESGPGPVLSQGRTVLVGGRPWRLEVHGGDAFLGGAPWEAPTLAGLLGLVASGVLYSVMREQARARGHAERSASDARTAHGRAHALVEQSPLATLVLSPDGRAILANQAWKDLWGDAPGPDYVIFSDARLEEARLIPAVHRAFAGVPVELPPRAFTVGAGPHAGEPRQIAQHLYPVRNDAGETTEIVLVQQDVTAQTRAEEAIREARRLESVGALAAGVAHDFNNLLGSIMVGADLGADMLPRSSPVRPLLTQIVSTCERAADLTRQLLAYAGKGRMVVAAVDLRDLVNELRPSLRAALPEAVALELELPDEPVLVDSDGAQVRQLLTNLVVNAGEAAREGRGRIVVRLRHGDLDLADIGQDYPGFPLAPGEHAVLEVEDDGVGMAPDTLERIYDPFYSTKFIGRGLGLAAVLGIVRAHHGAIAVTSTPGEGSRFRVALPMACPAANTGSFEVPFTIGGRTILVVDDEAVMREMAAAALEGAGFDVVVATNGRDAVERVRTRPGEVDLVLLDLTMPVMDGAEAFRRLKELRPELPVLVSSGYGEGDALARFEGLEVDGFIAKPYARGALLRAVGRLVRASAVA